MDRSQGSDFGSVTDYQVEIAEPAELEIADAVAWYKAKNMAAAHTFKVLVAETVEMISHSPLSWPKVSEQGIRRVILPRYPYTIFYSVAANLVTILAVTHHRRAPRDWN
jgi:plasmid stabilization system protein ParE